jgi:hypothetical protein
MRPPSGPLLDAGRSGCRPRIVAQGCQTQEDENPDGPPAWVDLTMGHRHPTGRRGCMVVVVKALTRHKPGQPLIVRGQVVVRPLTPFVPNRVDCAAAENVGRCVDRSSDQPDFPAEHANQERDACGEAQKRVVEEQPVPTIAWQITGVAGHCVGVAGHPSVENGISELNRREPEDGRGVRVTILVGKGMMLAMHRHPLAGPGARCHPDHDSARKGDRGLELHSSMGERAVEVDRRDDKGHLGRH